MANPPYHSLSHQEVLEKFKTDPTVGLTKNEVIKRQEKYGVNEIEDDKPKHLVLTLLWHQLNSLLIYILIAAAVITYFLDHALDTYVIIAVIIVNTTIGFIQEYKANKAIESLKEIVALISKVYRDGQLLEVPSKELVPGDIVLLEEGDRVPGDGRLIETNNMRATESALTGEAFPIEKNVKVLPAKTAMGDRKNFVWMSTFVASGFGKFVVTATGPKTAIGKIAKTLGEIKKEKSHFEIKTDRLAKQMSIIAIFGALITFIVGFFFRDLSFAEIFTFAVASLVSGIPEGLPAVLVIILATGARRMASKNAIIRSLPATETLSITDVIATDKTGTLTQNTMTIEEIYLPDQNFDVLGNGWLPKGEIQQNNKTVSLDDFPTLKKLIIGAGLCSRAMLVNKGTKEDPNYQIKGDPTEGASTVLAHKTNLFQEVEKIKIVDELPFIQDLKFKGVMTEENGDKIIYASGAPEKIIELSSRQLINNEETSFNPQQKQEMLEKVRRASAKAMRNIAIAYKKTDSKKRNLSPSAVNDLVFLGFVGMIDPPRKGAAEAVLKAKQAGIRVIMKTGDHIETAIAIAKEVNILDQDSNNKGDYPLAMTEEDLSPLSQDEFEETIEQVNVFARLTPDMKLRILETLQKKGRTVAMTGDGVNDVLALKKANIGIAMGKIGTDVAREASDIVLADDNFASLMDAVEEGRVVFVNTRQASAFLITTNFAEDIIIVLSIIIGLPLPLLASQILWLNLVTDGVVDIALAAEPGHGEVLLQPPRKKEENILSTKMLSFLSPIVFFMVLTTMWVFIAFLPQGINKARTGAFTMMVFTQLINIFNMRSLELSLFKIGIFTNKYIVGAVLLSVFLWFLAMNNSFLINIFRFEPLTSYELVKIGLLATTIFIVGETHKLGKTIWKKKLAKKAV